MIDLNTIVSLVIVGGVGWIAQFLRQVDRRLTVIETLMKIKNGIENEKQ